MTDSTSSVSTSPSTDLFSYGPAMGSQSPILLTHFDGAMDSGMAGRLAIVQMLRSLPAQRLATFDSDQLIDYRAHRPIVTVDDWVTTGLDVPTIALDLLHDDAGTPILLLHGPEPDLRWEAFSQAVADLAREAGVELTVSLHGLPSGVPHTRPVQVHVHATDASLVPDQAQMVAPLQFPSPLSIFLQTRLSTVGIDGVALLASVPYYMTDNAFPAASSAVLKRLSEMTGLALPLGDLERGAADDMASIKALVESNPEIAQTVVALEKTFDALDSSSTSADLSLDEAIAGASSADFDAALGEDVSASVEAFLATVERFEQQESSPVEDVIRVMSLLSDAAAHGDSIDSDPSDDDEVPTEPEMFNDAPSGDLSDGQEGRENVEPPTGKDSSDRTSQAELHAKQVEDETIAESDATSLPEPDMPSENPAAKSDIGTDPNAEVLSELEETKGLEPEEDDLTRDIPIIRPWQRISTKGGLPVDTTSPLAHRLTTQISVEETKEQPQAESEVPRHKQVSAEPHGRTQEQPQDRIQKEPQEGLQASTVAESQTRSHRQVPAEIEEVLQRIAEREARKEQGLPPLPSEPRHNGEPGDGDGIGENLDRH